MFYELLRTKSRRGVFLTFAVSLVLGMLQSCSSVKQGSGIEQHPARVPLAVFVIREISLQVLGRDLNQPFSVTVDSENNLYLSDTGNNRVIKFNSSLEPVLQVGGHGSQEGMLGEPTYLSLDGDLNLLVSEKSNQRVSRFNSKLNYVDAIEFYSISEQDRFGFPTGVAAQENDELWVADGQYNRIAVFDHLNNFSRMVGDFGYAGGQLYGPGKMTSADEGANLVCDLGNNRIAIYDQYGSFLSSWKHELTKMPVAAMLEDNNLWVLDGSNSKLLLFGTENEILLSTGPEISGTELPLEDATDFCLFNDGRVAIVDRGNNRLLICSLVYESTPDSNTPD